MAAAPPFHYKATHRPPFPSVAARPSRIYHHRQLLPVINHLKLPHVGKKWAAAAHVVDRMESAKFQHTLWGDHFLTAPAPHSSSTNNARLEMMREYEALKEEVRSMVTENHVAISEKLRLIDAIQRLGVGYHFETEIEEALESVYVLRGESFIEDHYNDDDLYHAALWFRLLRQQGFRVSPDGFRKFMDNEGKFRESLDSDDQGLLSLYDAAHVAFHGEDILDEAMTFTTKNLEPNNIAVHDSSSSIYNSLCFPVWRCFPRTLARHSIDVSSKEDDDHDQTIIVKFAKLDFNILQKLYQEELHQLSRWRVSLEVPIKFPYARDRLVECYYWGNGVNFDPRYSLSRIILAKFVYLVTVLDDVYDNFGNYDELEILTDAINRLDMSCLEAVPDTMRDIYVIIVNLFEEMEHDLSEAGHESTYCVDYSKAEFKRMCRAFLVETRWRTEGVVPTPEEYITVAKVSGSYPFLLTVSFCGMGDHISTAEAFEWVTDENNKFERGREHVASAVECHMRKHGVCEEEAIAAVWGEISGAWKDMAEGFQKPNPLPVALMNQILNSARAVAVSYEKADAFTQCHLLKAHLAALFANPVPL
ncbi:unnamed protein product [Linum tenue]|uniref:Uncharacterized protein n=1 Tax=Linum tenue TaxID=586396 RepID=A0AAV0M2W9_9ROSI|nr:unnamed protein product [Linum tenue]